MPRDPFQAAAAPVQFAAPLRQFGLTALNGAERFVTCQFNLLHAWNRYVCAQWREILQVRDPRGLQEFLAHQAEATQELAREVTEHASLMGCIGRDLARHGLHAVVPPVDERGAEPEPVRRRA